MKMKHPEFDIIHFSAEDMIATSGGTSGGPSYCTNSGTHYIVTSIDGSRVYADRFYYNYHNGDISATTPSPIPVPFPGPLFSTPAKVGSYYTQNTYDNDNYYYLCENQNHGQ